MNFAQTWTCWKTLILCDKRAFCRVTRTSNGRKFWSMGSKSRTMCNNQKHSLGRQEHANEDVFHHKVQHFLLMVIPGTKLCLARHQKGFQSSEGESSKERERERATDRPKERTRKANIFPFYLRQSGENDVSDTYVKSRGADLLSRRWCSYSNSSPQVN